MAHHNEIELTCTDWQNARTIGLWLHGGFDYAAKTKITIDGTPDVAAHLKIILNLFAKHFVDTATHLDVYDSPDEYITGALPPTNKRTRYMAFSQEINGIKFTRITHPDPQISNQVWEIEYYDNKIRFAAIHHKQKYVRPILSIRDGHDWTHHYDIGKTVDVAERFRTRTNLNQVEVNGDLGLVSAMAALLID